MVPFMGAPGGTGFMDAKLCMDWQYLGPVPPFVCIQVQNQCGKCQLSWVLRREGAESNLANATLCRYSSADGVYPQGKCHLSWVLR